MGNTLSEHGHVNRGVCNVGPDGLLKKVVETFNIEKKPDGISGFDGDGKLQKFTGNEVVSMNLWGFKPSFFDCLEKEFDSFINTHGMDLKSELLVPTTVDNFVKSGDIRIKILMSNERWFGVTYREDKPFVIESIKNMIRKGIYPARIYS